MEGSIWDNNNKKKILMQEFTYFDSHGKNWLNDTRLEMSAITHTDVTCRQQLVHLQGKIKMRWYLRYEMCGSHSDYKDLSLPECDAMSLWDWFPFFILTHCGRVMEIRIFTLQLCRTGDADLRF